MIMDPGKGPLPINLLVEDLAGQVPQGPQKYVVHKGPVCRPYGVLNPEETDKGDKTKGADKVEEAAEE